MGAQRTSNGFFYRYITFPSTDYNSYRDSTVSIIKNDSHLDLFKDGLDVVYIIMINEHILYDYPVGRFIEDATATLGPRFNVCVTRISIYKNRRETVINVKEYQQKIISNMKIMAVWCLLKKAKKFIPKPLIKQIVQKAIPWKVPG